MTFEVCQHTYQNSNDNVGTKKVVDVASSTEEAESKIQKIIKEEKYKHSGYDGKNKLWWARYEEAYPRYHFYVA